MGIFSSDDKGDGSSQVAEVTEEDASLTSKIALSTVKRILAVGLDGVGPLKSVDDIVAKARSEHSDPEKVIDEICSDHVREAAIGGFATGVGGLFTMPIALPANVISYYVLAARMVGGVAAVRGYDVKDPDVRTALTLTMIGADADDMLKKAGVAGGGKMAAIALDRVPRAAAMMINKGVGFRVATQLGSRMLGRLGRVVPLAGGAIGAGLDGFMMGRLADVARREFPEVEGNQITE